MQNNFLCTFNMQCIKIYWKKKHLARLFVIAVQVYNKYMKNKVKFANKINSFGEEPIVTCQALPSGPAKKH